MDPLRRPLRLLHTSDVHLGGGFRAPEAGRHLDHCLCPLGAIERAVDDHRPDAVLVVGDLFDNQRVGPDLVGDVLGRLGRLGVVCVVISGNHDIHDHGSLYRSTDPASHGLVFLDQPDGTTVELFGGALTVWGRAMDDHHRGFRPLQGVPARPATGGWWVVLGHGHFEPGDPGPIGRSSPIEPGEIEASGADYVALGHWHVRTEVSTESVTAWYSGAPYGPAATGVLNVVDLHPEAGVTVRPVDIELPPTGCGDR
jgi:DNA repair exonuclease SbcCD nuclease subunit